MRIRSLLPFVLFFAACESDRLGVNPPIARADAGIAGDSGSFQRDAKVESAPDAEVLDASAPDASAPDASAPDASAPDAEVLDAEVLDAEVLDAAPADSGEIAVIPGMLIADPTGNQIIQLASDGSLVGAYASPISNVSAVAFDRRTRDGFWIAGSGNTNPLFTKLDWSGAVVDTHDYAADRLFQFLDEGVRSLDYGLGPTAAEDAFLFLFTNHNNVDVVAIGHVAMVGWTGETSIGLQVGYSGLHVEVFSIADANALEYWTTTSGRIEEWGWNGNNGAVTTLNTPVGTIGGVAIASDGTYFVTDRTNIAVVHLDAMGAQLGAPITVPASSVSDLSLIE